VIEEAADYKLLINNRDNRQPRSPYTAFIQSPSERLLKAD